MSEEDLKPAEIDEMGTIILMLGLYLIVLAFFILLNAISESSEEKVKKVSESVGSGFGFQLEGEMSMRDDVEVTVDPVFEMVSNDIQGILESYVAMDDYRLTSNAEQMILRLKSSRVFMPSQVRIRPAMAELFTDLADVIASGRPGVRMEADVIVYGLEKEAKGLTMSAHELAGRRSSLFVRALIERGVDESSLSAAAVVAATPEVKVFFRMVVVDEQAALKEAKRILRQQQLMMQPPAVAPEGAAATGGHGAPASSGH